VSRFSRL